VAGPTGPTGPTGPAGSGAADGWVDPSQTWTYASPSTLTIAGDQTAIYAKGDKLKCTNSTLKYFYVIGVSYSAGTGLTTLTVTGGSDYSLANAAITANYYSKEVTPNGFPQWFNWSPTYGGFTATVPTNVVHRFSLIGTTCFLEITETTDGTSNASSFTLTAPIISATISNQSWFGNARVTDNGLTTSTDCFATIGSNTTTISFFKSGSATGFLTSGGKKCRNCFLSYEI